LYIVYCTSTYIHIYIKCGYLQICVYVCMFCIYIVHCILYIYIVYCVCIFYILYISVYSASAFSEISTFSHIYTHICRCRMYTYMHIYIKCRYLQPIPFPVTFPQLEAKLAGKAMCQAQEICVRQERYV